MPRSVSTRSFSDLRKMSLSVSSMTPEISAEARWKNLNQWLSSHREFWQPTPFTTPDPEWTRRWPKLKERVSAIPADQIKPLDDDPTLLARALGDDMPSLREVESLLALPSLSSPDRSSALTLPEVRAADMPGRKRLQSGAFASAVEPLGLPLVDWCCGKGHLARTLSPLCANKVSGFEWDPALVTEGNRLAQKYGDRVSLSCQDVMTDGLALPDRAHAVALHACGDLHRRLLQTSAKQSLPRLSLSPCCYHLTAADQHQPLSRVVRDHPDRLELTVTQLRLAVEETVTAPAREREELDRISEWRLGFDAMQRALRGVDAYLPVPSNPRWVARGDFAGFCQWAASKKTLTLPGNLDYGHWEARGRQRLAQVRRYELVRHLFRRPLELWLVLDYVLFLQEQGYEVTLGTFCPRSLTPRNLMIDAVIRR